MASFSRRISSIPKPPQPSYTAKPSLTQVTSDGNEPAPLEAYERPVELIRQEEYPHMNHGRTLMLYSRLQILTVTQEPTWITVAPPFMPAPP